MSLRYSLFINYLMIEALSLGFHMLILCYLFKIKNPKLYMLNAS